LRKDPWVLLAAFSAGVAIKMHKKEKEIEDEEDVHEEMTYCAETNLSTNN